MRHLPIQTSRVHVEDALKHLHDCEYRRQVGTAQSLAGALGISLDAAAELVAQLTRAELVELQDGQYQLTPSGRDYARQVIRAHRLYETYLAEQTGTREERWHPEAEKMEHQLSAEKVARLARDLGEPRFDPHGDPIPSATGDLPPLRGVSLLECPVGWEGQIVHIEDEPRSGYALVIAAGLASGMRLRVLQVADDRVQLNVEGRTVELSSLAAGHLLVAEMPAAEGFDESVTRLSALRPGERATVVGLSAAVRGAERDRLLDLGFVPGSVLEIDLLSPSGNPVGYLVRGATVALRREQAERILVRKL
jgi:DtxR family Mn-dependent transcriptional regulator